MNVNKNVFCNSPWYELHIFWNGDYAFCCQQTHPPYREWNTGPYEGTPNNQYNVKHMSMKEWHNSEPMQQARKKMFEDQRWQHCAGCWNEESAGTSSRRHRANQKSVIFPSHFTESFAQSPNIETFQQIKTNQMPVDLHIDLGNYCNLACKMCWAGASSKIAVQEKKWGTLKNDQWLGDDWTRDDDVWYRFLDEFNQLPIQNVHFMGGETVIQPRFEHMIDFMIMTGKSEKISMSYVTNGMKFNQRIAEKFTFFRSVNVEVSMETTTPANEYIRQGTHNQTVIDNIMKYKKYAHNVTMRPAIQSLSLRDFHTLLQFCLDHQLVMKGLIVDGPIGMQSSVIPKDIRQSWKQPYEALLANTDAYDPNINESNAHNHQQVVNLYAKQAISLCDQPTTNGLKELVAQCQRWDKVYNLNAYDIYPELTHIFKQHAY